MSLTLEISPELESFLEAEATRTGKDVTSVAEAVLRKSLCPGEHSSAPRLTAEEARLLEEINRGPTTSEMEGYIALIRKRQSETITEDELDELRSFTQRMEELAVLRLKNLKKLAELRGVDVEGLMTELQIGPPDVL
ncbi:MAG: hypothetical protein QF473_00995 [Planctomycetota bacterium]|nr:hypothetical protein [Planctomycetota bacterium]